MRLVTRSDFDGLACGALLREAGLIDSFLFVHPKDIQDGLIQITANDILANIPYAAGCGMWFDHHTSEGERLGSISYRGMSRVAPSCARVIYDFLGGASRYSAHWDPMMEAVDKVDSANLTIKEIENPQGWILLGFLMDPRTGLGRFRDFRVSNYKLMEMLIEMCRFKTAEEILADPDVLERATFYLEQAPLYANMIKSCSTLRGQVLVIDFRDLSVIYPGNRFLPYTMYPTSKVSIHLTWARDEKNVALAMGNSIINRDSQANLGSIALHFGGGGHEVVATCQVDSAAVEETLSTIIDFIHEENGYHGQLG
ncbi:MAG: exopolyphosphatase [Deltaproteobacteria bacterium]|jgi:oligoribonuclease NrnB/cAMP/cGMP phosphodiesterase (DHH superfamily)|nr:exopolyphosphatase [Deltaproteobacteria bacterium]